MTMLAHHLHTEPFLQAATIAAKSGSDDSGDRTKLMVVIVVAVLALILVRQFARREVSAGFYAWVVLLLIFGFAEDGPTETHGKGIPLFAVTLAVSVFWGLLRGWRMPIWREPDGRLMRQGNIVIALLWVATIASRLALDYVGIKVLDTPFHVGNLYIAVAVTLAVQQMVIERRGAGTAGQTRRNLGSLQFGPRR